MTQIIHKSDRKVEVEAKSVYSWMQTFTWSILKSTHPLTCDSAAANLRLIKSWIIFAVLHGEQCVDKAICCCRSRPQADSASCQTAEERVWDSDGSCVCVFLCVICAHNQDHMDARLHCVRSDERSVFHDRVCVSVTVCVWVCSECSWKIPRALFFFFFFLFLFLDTKCWYYPRFWIQRWKPAVRSFILCTSRQSIASQKH